MRIMIFAAGGDTGGGKSHILNLAREMSADNIVRLVCFRIGEMSRDAAGMGIDTAFIDHKKGWHATKAFASEQVKSFKPDIIHCHGSKANLLGIIVKKIANVPVITTVHSDPNLDYMGSPLRNITYGNLNRFALRHMDHLIAVGGAMHNLLISRRFNPYKISHIYNAMDFSEEGVWHGAKNTVTVGIAARLNPVKDIPTLIKAFAKSYEKDKRLRLSIAGAGEEKEKLISLADEYGISEVTVFEGWVSDMAAYFKRIDINVLCSISETFPYSILEGALQYVPVVSSDVGGIPYLVKDGENGILFQPGDVNALSSAILRLAGDEALRKRLAENLHNKIKEEFSISRFKIDHLEIYNKVIARSSRPARDGVVLCGAYGKGNAGDDAILRAITGSLRNIDSDIPLFVMSRKPMETKLQNHVDSVFTFNVPKLIYLLKKSRLLISGGGTLIQDVTSTRSLRFYLFVIKAAKLAGAKVEMYGCGIGPINKPVNRRKTAGVLNSCVDVITLRDSISIDLLSEMRVDNPEIVLSADPTVNLPAADIAVTEKICKLLDIPSDAKKLVFCLRPWNEFSDYKPVISAAEYAYRTYSLIPVFLPMEYPRDVAIGKEIAQELNKTGVPAVYSEKHHSIDELRGILSGAELVVGMRLHSLVFAASGGSPIVGISYDVKVDSFIKDSKAKRNIPLSALTAEALKQNIDMALADGRAMGAMTKARLQKLERLNAEYADKLLKEAI